MTARYKLLNNVLGLIIFVVASIVYISTIEPTASFWDCGEYIACSYKLEVGHPPGAPTFLLIGRLFTLFAGDPKFVAASINVMSALASAGTILFMFWSITMLGQKLIKAMKQEFTEGRMFAILASGAVGAMAYCFSDSFWFSAVEGEVYGMSSFFTALVFWGILKWDADDSPRADRWIVFIAYMMGLSVGVHLLNLLAIPSIVFIVYFKKFQNPDRKGLIIALLVAVGLLGVVQNGIIPGIVSAAANYELLFVNALGLPFNGGTIIYFILLVGMIVSGLMYTTRGGKQLYQIFLGTAGAFFFFTLVGAAMYGKVLLPFITCAGVAYLIYRYRDHRVVLNTVILCFTVLLIGYSSFFVLVIRSQANTPMDENNPENAISLLAYLNREQYGDWPILYGPYFNAPIAAGDDYADDGNPVYAQDETTGEYVVIDGRKQSVYKYAPEMCTVFPRMWETQSHKAQYETWSDFAHNNSTVEVTDRNTGQLKKMKKPTFTGNLRYFFTYQMNWMYLRYFYWNFVGRQNDIQGHSNVTDGNWQSGIKAMADVDMDKAPQRMRDNKANNKFYMLPLFLGLLGLWFHFSRDWKSALVVTLMFLFTGLAIVIYLNQYPNQPRERDYAYAGSFYAFAFWIGLGVYALYDLIAQYLKIKQVAAAGMAAVMGCTIPYIMGQQGWDDHNRSNRYTARDFAGNYLTTCDKYAILFTNGDNDTFPLWYAQEVEENRTDMRVLNLSLLNTDWYIDQASRAAYDSPRVPFSLSKSKTRQGSCDQVYFDPDLFPKERGKPPVKVGQPMSARALIDMIRNNESSAMRINQGTDDDGNSYADTVFVLPSNRVYIPVDKAAVKANGTVPANTPDSLILDRVEWTINKQYLMKADLMILDLLATNNWKRPVYFAVTAGSDSYLDLDNVQVADETSPEGYRMTSFFRLEGLAYRLVPMMGDRQSFSGSVLCNTDIMYNKIMGVKGSPEFPGFKWGGLEDTTKNIYMDENNLRFTTNQRLQMITLANFLNEDKQFGKAVEVLDYSLKVMPKKHVPYEPLMAYMVEGYYKAKAVEKANALSKILFDQCEEEFRFYTSEDVQENSSSGAYSSDIANLKRALQMLENAANENKQVDLSKAYATRMSALGIKTAEQENAEMRGGRQQQPNQQAMIDSFMAQMRRDSMNAGKGAEKKSDK
ncbi:MAG: DUF2723 domain-containing protein [Bacteroidota bacterium]|nr:DUF2723 domain-containing protein [Bacteroidota bacterium]